MTDEAQPFISACRPRCRSHRVLRFVGLSIDGKIGVGVFPDGEELFVGFASGCVIAHQMLCPAELKPGQRAGDVSQAQTGILDQFLELARCRSATRYSFPGTKYDWDVVHISSAARTVWSNN